MNYRLVLWDFDGTLADSLHIAVEIYNEIAPRYKALPLHDPETLRGLTAREMMRLHKIRWHRFPFLIRSFLAEQTRRMSRVNLHNGIFDILTELKEAGVRQAIVSSNSETNIRLCLQEHDAEHFFEFVVGVRTLFGKKKGLKEALRLANLTADDVLYVGDETRDIQAAHQVQLPIACVTWGVNTSALLSQHQPEHLIERPGELMSIVQGA